MTRPVVSDTAEELFARLGPWSRADGEDTDWALLTFCDAMTVHLERLNQVIRDTDDAPGWAIVMNPDTCPDDWLPWLGQFVGVRAIPGEDPAVLRQRIKDRPGWQRGTLAAMIAEIKATLTGTKTVYLRERAGSAYRLAVGTIDSETPDPAATKKAAIAQKPAGIVLTYHTVPGAGSMTWFELYLRFGTWQDVKNHFTTWNDVKTDNPH